MSKIKLNNRTIYYSSYSNEDAAWRVVENAVKQQWIVMGDVGEYWVMNPADAQRLVKAGYEYLS